MEGTIITDGDAQIEKTVEDLREANKSNEKLLRAISAKMVRRPPFRFLHDIIINMLNAHNYHADLYSGDELNGRYMERDAKFAFLQKIVDVVTEDFPAVADLGIQIGKILAGKYCEKTRTFLQYLCLAITGATGNIWGWDSLSRLEGSVEQTVSALSPCAHTCQHDPMHVYMIS